jgi:hypothetical protein
MATIALIVRDTIKFATVTSPCAVTVVPRGHPIALSVTTVTVNALIVPINEMSDLVLRVIHVPMSIVPTTIVEDVFAEAVVLAVDADVVVVLVVVVVIAIAVRALIPLAHLQP